MKDWHVCVLAAPIWALVGAVEAAPMDSYARWLAVGWCATGVVLCLFGRRPA